MRLGVRILLLTRCAFVVFLATVFAQTPSGQQEQPEFIKQGQQLMRDGKLEDALALYRKTLQSEPNSLPANIAAGSVLDLMGRNEEARKYLQKVIDTADTPEHKAMAQRAMAMSYAFEGDCGKTAEYDKLVFEYYGTVKNFYQQGEIADEIARVCLDSVDDGRNRYPADRMEAAMSWYKTGHDAGLKEPEIKPERVDLWNFRWEHAQARIAAQEGKQADAQKHVAAAKSILDKGTLPQQQEQFLPYLLGYVAFYGGDYKTALDEFLKANQNDPFIQCMTGRTYEKLGDKTKAIEFYKKAVTAISHNPPAAYAVPYSRRRLAQLGN
jgi:tetratricopeptide (TPR) repeat protein